jgi:hypothetical protein
MRHTPGSTQLDSLTTPYTCVYAPLLADLSDAERQAVFRAFWAACRPWGTTRLDAIPAEWRFLDELSQAAGAAGLAALRFDHFGNWHENVLGLGWAGYLAARPGALRETIRRRLRRAERVADAHFTLSQLPDQLASAVAAFEAVYAKSWKEPEPYPAFNATLIRATAAAQSLRLGIWWIGAQPVAVQFWVVEHRRACVLKLAHDEAFKAHSPGTVLTALMLQRLLDQDGVEEIDFGRGDDAYKRDWAASRRQRVGLVIANPRRLSGLAELGRHAAGRFRAGLRG